MRLLIFSLFAVAACTDAEQVPAPVLSPMVVGKIEDARIREASGLARSRRQDNLLWIINDSGAEEWVHAVNLRGRRAGEFDLKKSKNKDWEDLASFKFDEKPYLLIADIGDNEARRKSRTLYIVEEPRAEKKAQASIAWEINYRYPDGPRDAEAVAIDIDNAQALLLSKRDIPPVLYALPLQPDDDKRITATRLGAIHSLPPPSRQDVEFAPKTNDWHWQPVGMDISTDNRAAVILTTRAVYYYEKPPDEDWLDALNQAPIRVSLGDFRNAEAIAFVNDERSVIVTGERKHSPLLLIDFNEVPAK